MSETTEDRVDVVEALRWARDEAQGLADVWVPVKDRAEAQRRADVLRELADDLETLRPWFRYLARCRPMIDTTPESDAIVRLARRLDVP